MRVALENLLFRMISSPISQRIGRNNLIALASFAALGVFSAGVYFGVRALRYCFSQNPAGPVGGVNRAAQAALPQPPIQLYFPPEVKKVLDSLFEGSLYSVDTLPLYPQIVHLKEGKATLKYKMIDKVVKGITNTGQNFIAIRVGSSLTIEQIEKQVGKIGMKRALLDDCIFITQSPSLSLPEGGQGEFVLNGFGSDKTYSPQFLTAPFTNAKDGKLIEDQAANFQLLKTLLQEGMAPDRNGLIWKIGDPKEFFK